MLRLIVIFSFITFSMLLFQLLKYAAGKQKAIYRIKKYTNVEETMGERRKPAKRELRAGIGVLAKGVGSLKFLEGYKKSVQSKLNRAHVLLKAEEFITIRIILLLGPGGIISLFSGSIAPLFIIGAAGWLIPGLILKGKIRKRIKSLNEQLGDAIVLISNSLKAGYSFFQSVDIVAKEMAPPISEEFTILQKEINLGTVTEKALENLVSRVGSDDLELVITAVLIQRQTGGNLAEVLDNISFTIRDRIKIKAEVRTVTAQGRMSGLIISLLPPILGVIIYLINPEHMSLLFTSPLGLMIVGFSMVMELIGIYFINRIVKIEV